MSKTAFVFPGQGAQYPGMGKGLSEKIEEIAGKNIAKLCTEASEDELKQTINSQPAILAVSIAMYEVLLKKINCLPDFVAGHSLGEYSALYAAGVISLEEIFPLVMKRAELMNNAPQGAMTAILGLTEDKITELVQQASVEGIICAANYNTQIQTVISGEVKAIEKANELAKTLGAKRVVPLAVSGGFHSPLMKPVADSFAKFVNDTNINDATIPLVTNVDTQPTIDKAEFSFKMVKQLYSSVYWKQSVAYMVEQGVTKFYEVGPGKVLSGMIKKIAPEVEVYSIEEEFNKCLM